MKRIFLFLLGCAFLMGCMASQIRLDETAAISIKRIAIIPLESPPFLISGPAVDQSALGPYIKTAAPLVSVPNMDVMRAGGVLVSIFGIAMFVEAGVSGRQLPGDKATIEKARAELWMPTVEFAQGGNRDVVYLLTNLCSAAILRACQDPPA